MPRSTDLLDNPVDRFLVAVRTATIDACDAWADDVTLDATVPNWRFRATGVAGIKDTYRSWFADPGELLEVRRERTPSGEVLSYLFAWQEHGVPHTSHHLHVLDIAEGLIVSDKVFCGGRWPAALMAEMEAAGA